MSDDLAGLESMPSWLRELDDSQRVLAAIRRAVPNVRRAKLSGVRLKPGKWTARCTLVLDDDGPDVQLNATILPPGGDDPRVETRPSGRPGSAGWRCWIPELRLELASRTEPEAELPSLRTLTDPESARAFLEEAIRSGAPAYRELRIISAEPKVMRYSPGSRCTVLYRLQFPEDRADTWPDVVVAKTYHRSDKGRIAWEGMHALWNSPITTSGIVGVAEPLAWVPEQKILVQGPVREERTLKDLLLATLSGAESGSWDQLHDYLSKAAAGLAQLHHSGAASSERTNWEEEYAEVRELSNRLGSVFPELERSALPILDEWKRLADRIPEDAPLPAHRSFRPAQVLLYHGDISFIDFDGFCWCEPAIDVALFRATARDLAMSALAEDTELEDRLRTIDDLCDHFLISYEAHASIARGRVALWEALDLMTNVLHSWTKAKPARLVHALALLRHHMAGLRALAGT
jgi:Phosphotransferase enzyme family